MVLVSPLASLAEELFWAHMVEHLAIADLGALLIVVGLTGPVLAPVLRIGLFDRLRVLAHPLVALPLWAIDLVAWHVPALHEAALHHDGVHALQHLCFIFFGANVWMCLFGPLPKPAWFGTGWKAGYIIAVRLVGAALANAFLFGGDAFYDAYAPGEALHGICGADDQVVAGCDHDGRGVAADDRPLLLAVPARGAGERRAPGAAGPGRGAGVDLTTERAARAVAAGRGAELRARIEGRDGSRGREA